MPSTRLTKDVKKSILEKLLRRAFNEKVQTLTDRCADFAERLYKEIYGPKLKAMEELPDGWLPRQEYICVSFAGEYTQIRFNGTLDDWSNSRLGNLGDELTEKKKYFPSRDTGNRAIRAYNPQDPMCLEFEALSSEREELHDEIVKAKQQATSVLESVTTVEKLIHVWPEVEAFAKEFLGDGQRKALLPEVPRSQLNSIFELPPEGV